VPKCLVAEVSGSRTSTTVEVVVYHDLAYHPTTDSINKTRSDVAMTQCPMATLLLNPQGVRMTILADSVGFDVPRDTSCHHAHTRCNIRRTSSIGLDY